MDTPDSCLTDGQSALVTLTCTTCVLENATDVCVETYLCTGRLEVSGRTPRTGMRSAGVQNAGADGKCGSGIRKLGSVSFDLRCRNNVRHEMRR
jgi:hypothetical protein